MPRLVHALFERAAAQQGDVSITLSYVEIYNNDLFDLLEPWKAHLETEDRRKDLQKRRARLRIREDARGGTHIPELREVKVASANEVFQLLHRGNTNRSSRHTAMNQHSSRGHAILQLRLRQRSAATPATVTSTKLNLVDLAGSERNHEASSGASAAETHSINVSLSALISVVAALTNCSPHVPYRDSKLTLMLKDSLGGNCNTYLLATMAPTESCFQESVSTLKFADRASNIMNMMVRNTKPDLMGLLERKDQEISRLRAMLVAFTEAQGNERSRNVGDARRSSDSTARGIRRSTGELQAKQLQAQIDELQACSSRTTSCTCSVALLLCHTPGSATQHDMQPTCMLRARDIVRAVCK